ncbi:MAG: hypothetical protein ACE37J_11770 [Pikeienuella sp.]|uniref:hypothetical protein n=1 Tax=Pikeienuella sp. TaxID=2831957 RepID=UPI00391CF135
MMKAISPAAAETIGLDLRAKRVVVIAIGDDNQFGLAAWGRTPVDQVAAERWISLGEGEATAISIGEQQ